MLEQQTGFARKGGWVHQGQLAVLHPFLKRGARVDPQSQQTDIIWFHRREDFDIARASYPQIGRVFLADGDALILPQDLSLFFR